MLTRLFENENTGADPTLEWRSRDILTLYDNVVSWISIFVVH